jgi:hypothetical protein
MFLSRKEKERLVIDLYYNQGKTFRDIAKEVRMSFSDISFIIKKKEAEEEEEKNNTNKDKNQQLSLFAKAYKLYSKGKSPVQVAIDLNISESQATQFYREYWNLLGLYWLKCLYEKTNGKIWPLWELYQELIEKRNMNMEQVGDVVDTAIDRLPYMETLYEQAKDEVGKMQDKRQWLLNEIDFLNDKISKLQKTFYSFEEQSSIMKEDEGMQNLTDQKEIMKILAVSVANYVQALVDRTTCSSTGFSSSCSNAPLSLPSSSSTASSVQFNQNDTFLNQESEIHEIHKGDISD